MACELGETVDCFTLNDLLDEVLDRIEKTNGLEFVPDDHLSILIDYFKGELAARFLDDPT